MKTETIRKKGDQWCLFAKKKDKKGHHKNLGCYDTKGGAEKREKQVQFFKHQALDRIIDALVEGALLSREAMLIEVELPEQTDDLPDPEEEGAQYLKTAPIWAMQMGREFDVVTLEGPVTGDEGDWLAKNPETEELWPINDEVFKKSYAPVEGEKKEGLSKFGPIPGVSVKDTFRFYNKATEAEVNEVQDAIWADDFDKARAIFKRVLGESKEEMAGISTVERLWRLADQLGLTDIDIVSGREFQHMMGVSPRDDPFAPRIGDIRISTPDETFEVRNYRQGEAALRLLASNPDASWGDIMRAIENV